MGNRKKIAAFARRMSRGALTAIDVMNEFSFLVAVRRALTVTIPVILIGTFARLLAGLPIVGYRGLMSALFGVDWIAFFLTIERSTYALTALLVNIAVSSEMCHRSRWEKSLRVAPMAVTLVSVCCFFIVTSADGAALTFNWIGPNGVFWALTVAIASTALFRLFARVLFFNAQLYGNSPDCDLTGVLGSIAPAVGVVLVFTVLRHLAFGIVSMQDFQAFIASTQAAMFAVPGGRSVSLAQGALGALLTSALWFVGIHGSGPMGTIAAAATPGSAGAAVSAQTFFNVFVSIGGTGATLGLIAAVLIASKRGNLKRLAGFGALPAIINSNGLVLFGIPVVLNAYLLIPFLAAPTLVAIVSYGVIATGIMPVPLAPVDQATPFLLGGYLAAGGSASGVVLQLVGLGVSTAVYLPFVRLYDRLISRNNERTLHSLKERIERAGERYNYQLMNARDAEGNLARAIAADMGLALRDAFDSFGVMRNNPRNHGDGIDADRGDSGDSGRERGSERDGDRDGNNPAPGTGSDGFRRFRLLERLARRYRRRSEYSQLPELPLPSRAAQRIGKLSMMYQPLMEYDGTITGIEALLRWKHATFGYIPPSLVIAIAEEAGYKNELGRFTFMSAFSTLKELLSQGISDIVMSVNVTPSQLDDSSLPAQASDLARLFGVPPRLIELEITENAALGGRQRIETLKQLHAKGFRLAIDDFGIGHGSIMYLKQFDLHTLKLDGSLSREVESSHACREIVSSIVQLADTLNLNVIAEFVETPNQREILSDLGCHRFQGYLYSAALTVDGLATYCRRHAHVGGAAAAQKLPAAQKLHTAPERARRNDAASAVSGKQR